MPPTGVIPSSSDTRPSKKAVVSVGLGITPVVAVGVTVDVEVGIGVGVEVLVGVSVGTSVLVAVGILVSVAVGSNTTNDTGVSLAIYSTTVPGASIPLTVIIPPPARTIVPVMIATVTPT
jgi:hypothetical protein